MSPTPSSTCYSIQPQNQARQSNVADSEKWPCKVCTYLNWPRSLRCVQCCTKRGGEAIERGNKDKDNEADADRAGEALQALLLHRYPYQCQTQSNPFPETEAPKAECDATGGTGTERRTEPRQMYLYLWMYLRIMSQGQGHRFCLANRCLTLLTSWKWWYWGTEESNTLSG